MKKLAAILVLCLGIALLARLHSLHGEVKRQSFIDESRPSDVIVVLGAAEYNGRPSPVLRARLDHAYTLYTRRLAPKLITTGGAGGDPQFTEGQVGRDYLVKRGVPSEDILIEAEGGSTVHSIVAVSEIMRRMGLRSAIVVSDGYHIFRVKRILEHEGMTVHGSPRPDPGPRGSDYEWLYLRQAFAYMLWRAGINI